MTWLLAHRKLCALAASHLGIGVLGWALHRRPPPPAVEWHARSGFEGAETEAVQVSEKQAPTRVTTVQEEFADEARDQDAGEDGGDHTQAGAVPARHDRLLKRTVTVEERGESSRETNRRDEAHVAASEQQELKVTPAALASKALGFRFDDPLGGRQLRVEGGVRAIGPFWLRLGWKPADGLKGLSPGVEAQW